MAIQIGAKPDAGFDDPLGMLKDCHRRIENFLRVLCHVVESRQEGSLGAEEVSAVQSALDYFRMGGQRHTQDEEESLFPRIVAACAEDSLEALGKLELEHDEANRLHTAVDRLFSDWIDSRQISRAERESLRAGVNRLRSLYHDHIRLEEELVFPRAAERLNAEDLAAIGKEFRARRLVIRPKSP
jgi:hemerythrin-like domain-containing protein